MDPEEINAHLEQDAKMFYEQCHEHDNETHFKVLMTHTYYILNIEAANHANVDKLHKWFEALEDNI